MKRAALENRTRALVALSTRQRDVIADALAPWQSGARRIDRSTRWMSERAGWIGLAAGVGAGVLAAFKPWLVVRSARVVAMAAWPIWRIVRNRRRLNPGARLLES